MQPTTQRPQDRTHCQQSPQNHPDPPAPCPSLPPGLLGDSGVGNRRATYTWKHIAEEAETESQAPAQGQDL
ncbi:hypothetical protein VZT92_025530 [Zoarces viviparus]|uniref:Uncharacterized protein n=1 Tax=Zoarces viviparus TaxID=48416 RepID=A0AAW1DXD4_ZOAVI